mmetsp:Transcript_15616/g.26929  ORF Transcript_15616/g.26929 Transcript_15616/m.26929 type:complete len:201 (+) Transcript_15616:918-1520(+)
MIRKGTRWNRQLCHRHVANRTGQSFSSEPAVGGGYLNSKKTSWRLSEFADTLEPIVLDKQGKNYKLEIQKFETTSLRPFHNRLRPSHNRHHPCHNRRNRHHPSHNRHNRRRPLVHPCHIRSRRRYHPPYRIHSHRPCRDRFRHSPSCRHPCHSPWSRCRNGRPCNGRLRSLHCNGRSRRTPTGRCSSSYCCHDRNRLVGP